MEVKPSNNLLAQTSFQDFNEKYAKMMERGNMYAYQIQKMRQDDNLFRTHSHDKLDQESINDTSPGEGSLFISGSSAPICLVKEKRKPPKAYKAPLPKTRRSGLKGKEGKFGIPPIHGFG